MPRTASFSAVAKYSKGKLASSVNRATDGKCSHHSSKALTTEDEEMMGSKGHLGSQSSKSLITTVLFVLTQHFRLRGLQEHTACMLKIFQSAKAAIASSASRTKRIPQERVRAAFAKKMSGSAANVCNWWTEMSSQASEDVPVT